MKKRIFNICNQLAEQGTKPTLVRVRNELGGGSFSTINPFLRQWKECRKMNDTQELIDLRNETAVIGQKVTALMWKAVDDYCTKIKTDLQGELIALQTKVVKADATINLLRMELEEVHRQKALLERMLIVSQSINKQSTGNLTTKNYR
jgi:FtsZ-binding cell division protein ZapB